MQNLNLLLAKPWFEVGNWARIFFALITALGVGAKVIHINCKFAAANNIVHKES
jgi:hypothetical protein